MSEQVQLFIIAGCIFGTSPPGVHAGLPTDAEEADPPRKEIPVISVTQLRGQATVQTMVRIEVPDIPGLVSEVWCYEDVLRHGEAFPLDNGAWRLLHRHPEGAVVETRIVPLPGAVDWFVTVTGPTAEAVRAVDSVNGCWQFKRSETFSREPGAHYAESFAHRCFLFTEEGFTSLGDTVRYPDKRFPPDHQQNNPPYVQRYIPAWVEHPGQPSGGWGVSDDRPVESIIGVVSRDQAYLAAWAARQSDDLSQGFHDCIHLRPNLLLYYDAARNRTEGHFRMYFMKADANALLARYREDFAPRSEAPEAATVAEPVIGAPEAGSDFVIPGLGMAFTWIASLNLWAGRHEVTNAAFRAYRSDHDSGLFQGFSLNQNEQPVVDVSFDDARAFTEWLTAREEVAGRLPQGYRYRLPDDNEWTVLVRAGTGRTFPWGDSLPPTRGNYADETAGRIFAEWRIVEGYDDAFAVSAPVAHSGENEWGLFGMGGNVWEWTSEEENGALVVRGGSWITGGAETAWWVRFDSETQMRADYRDFAFGHSRRSPVIGFRCLLAP